MVGEEDGKCYKCKEGYILNEEGLCDTVMESDVCTSMGSLDHYEKSIDYLSGNPFNLGCIECKDGMRSVSFDFVP